MNLYAESNFIMELALQRTEHAECTRLLELARSGAIRLLLPSFSVGGPYEAWVRRTRQRTELRRRLEMEVAELGRSAPYAGSAQTTSGVLSMLGASSTGEKEQLDTVISEVLDEAELIPITREVFRAAKAAEGEMELTPQDAIVFASVVTDLQQAPPGEKCFVTTNAHDFYTPAVRARLAQHDCKLVTRFTDAVGFVRSRN